MQPIAAQEPNTLMRSFVSEVVHHSLHRAVQQIGLPAFPLQVFLLEVNRAFEGLDGRFPDDHDSLVKLWRSIWHGEIIAAQVQEDDPVFYVRGGRGSMGVVMRLVCAHDEWRVDRVVSIYHRPLLEARWFSRAALAVAIIAAAAVGFAGHSLTGHLISGATPSAAAAITAAPANMVKGTSSGERAPSHTLKALTPSGMITGRDKSNVRAHTRKLNPVHAGKSHPAAPTTGLSVSPRHTYTFTLGLGMPLYNLAQFLYDKKLVTSAIGFDMTMKQDGLNSDVQAGSYSFRSGMTVGQLVNVLKAGPTGSGSNS